MWAGTEAKDEAVRDWCVRVTGATGQDRRFARVNQGEFDARKPATLAQAVDGRPRCQGLLGDVLPALGRSCDGAGVKTCFTLASKIRRHEGATEMRFATRT